MSASSGQGGSASAGEGAGASLLRRNARRALLTLALWAGFWLLALALVGALAWVPVAQGLYAGGPGPSGLLAGAGALVLLWALRPRGLFARAEAAPEPLSAERFPQLIALVDEVAERVGSRVPRRVVLSPRATAYIFMERRWLGLRREAVVGVGLPLFALLSREELASVLAHEFGHHKGGDLLLGPWVYRTRGALARAVDDLEDSAFLLDLPFRLYGALFLRVSGAASREQELAADALAAATCGAAPTASALREVHERGDLWTAYLDLELVPHIERGARLPVLEGFRRFLAQQPRRSEVEEALRRLAHHAPSPGDSHPPLDERLAALGDAGLAGAARAAGGCVELLGGEAAAEDAWYERFTSGELQPQSWEALAERTLLPQTLQRLEGTALEPGKAPLEALPELIAQGAALWDQLRPAGLDLLSPEAKRQRARDLLGDWLAATLARHGFTPRQLPGTALWLERGEERVEPAALVQRLAEGTLQPAAYRTWCRALEAAPRAATA